MSNGVPYRSSDGWRVETCFELPDDRELSFVTRKRSGGMLCTVASVHRRVGGMVVFTMYEDYMRTIRREDARCTYKSVLQQHLDALKDKAIVMAAVKAHYAAQEKK